MDDIIALFDRIDSYKKCAPPQPTPFAFTCSGKRLYALAWPQGLWVCADLQHLFGFKTHCLSAASAADLWDDGMLLLDGIHLEFTDRDRLDDDDYALVTAAGRRYRGKGRWPQMRRYRPYHVPWDLDEDDVATLQSALIAAERLAQYGLPEQGLPTLGPRGGLRIEPLPDAPAPQYPRLALQNEMLIARLRRLPVRASAWDVTVQAFPFPTSGEEGGPPVFSMMLLLVDEQSDNVLHLGIESALTADGPEQLAAAFLQETVRIGWRPRALHCANARAEALLGDLFRSLSTPVDLSPDLPQLQEAFLSLLTIPRQ